MISGPPPSLSLAVMALLPVVAVLFLMVGRSWSGGRAGAVGWVVALALAMGAFGAGPRLILVAQGRAVVLSLYVLYVIWSALALYNVVASAGAFPAISRGVSSLTSNPTLQLIVLAWVFASFLQGVTGFGVPVAVVAPLLIGLGFAPLTSVVAASLGHAWAVTFGSVSSAFYALLAVTGRTPEELAPTSAALLGFTCLMCGLAVAGAGGGRRAAFRALPAILLVGGVMAGVQYGATLTRLWPLAAFLAGAAGLVAVAAFAKLLPRRSGQSTAARRAPDPRPAPSEASPGQIATQAARRAEPSFVLASSAYVILLIVVISGQLIGPLNRALNAVELRVQFPATSTTLGWVNAAGTGQSISLFGHAGALIIYSCLVAYLVYRRAGRYEAGDWRRIVRRTAGGAGDATLGILFLVGMAMFMTESGMTHVLAVRLAAASGGAFPAVSPFVGALGGFMTGSNTSSNVVFAPLQETTAVMLGYWPPLILAAQNVGGAVGSVLSPAKIIVGCSTAGLAGMEGIVLRRCLRGGVAMVAATGVVTLLLTRLPHP